MRIKDLLKGCNVKASGFKAVEELENHVDNDYTSSEVVLSTLPAALLLEKGIKEYVSLRLERGQVFHTAEEIIEANVPVDGYKIIDEFSGADILKIKDTIIVSRHEGTIGLLKDKYPNANVLDGNVSANDVKDKHVVGNLPPFLITECALYTPVMIKDFDYTKDGDLKGSDLKERFELGTPFKLEHIPLNKPSFTNLEDVLSFFTLYDNSDIGSESVYCSVIKKSYGDSFHINVQMDFVLENLGYEIKKYRFNRYETHAQAWVATKDDEQHVLQVLVWMEYQ